MLDGIRCIIKKATYQSQPTGCVERIISLKNIEESGQMKYFPKTNVIQFYIKHRPHIIIKFFLDREYNIRKLEHRELISFLHVFISKNEKATIKFEKTKLKGKENGLSFV